MIKFWKVKVDGGGMRSTERPFSYCMHCITVCLLHLMVVLKSFLSCLSRERLLTIYVVVQGGTVIGSD